MILVDTIAHHKKFLLAGDLIGGPGGPSRALAMYIAAIGYARDGLTDGVVHDVFLETFVLDSEPKRVANALSSRRVQLFHRVKGGYKIHDFHHHNGSADKLRHQRELARERKRKQRALEAVENSPAPKKSHAVTQGVTRDMGRDSRARDLEKEKEGETEVRTGVPNVRSASPPFTVPKREQRPRGRHVSSGVEVSEKQKDALTRTPAADGNYAVLVRLVHAVMDEAHDGNPTSPDVIEAVKSAAATRRIDYPPDVFNRALRSAAAQRLTGRGQPQATGPLAPLVEKVRGALRDHKPEVFRTMLAGARRR